MSSKENRPPPPSNTSEKKDFIVDSKVLKARYNLAKVLSRLVEKDTNLLQLLSGLTKENTVKNYYEDEFFLHLEMTKKHELLKNKSLQEYLINFGGLETKETLDFLCEHDPGLTILLAGNVNSKKVSNCIYLDDGFNDMDSTAQIPFFRNGRLGKKKISEKLEERVLVLRESEVFMTDSEIKEGKYTTENGELRRIGNTPCGLPIVIFQITKTTSVLPQLKATHTNCGERDTEEGTETLYRFRTDNDFDGGFRGKGEFLFYVIFANDIDYTVGNAGRVDINGSALSYLRKRYTGVRGNRRWHYINTEIINWNLHNDGDRMKYILYEDDGGNERIINASLGFKFKPIDGVESNVNLAIPIVINNGDDFIGESIVEYCQDIAPNGFIYNPGSKVFFEMKEKS